MIYINDKLRISKVDDNCLQIEVNKETISKKDKRENNEVAVGWVLR